MHPDTLTHQYEEALSLAESGRYEQALEKMLGYLKAAPSDGKALNDAGTILFCMQRGTEAIAYFERALTACSGDEQAQVYWNLCQACLQEGFPEKASELFHRMRNHGTLNADILSRTADAFLQRNELGNAVETLLLSLALYPNQEVLVPMLEVIRKRRIQGTLFADAETPMVHNLRASLESRVPLETCVCALPQMIAERQLRAGAVIYAGIGPSLLHGLSAAKACKLIVVLNECDIYNPFAGQLRWSAADMVLACASVEAIEDFKEITGVRAIQASGAIDAQRPDVHEKKHGKRIAAVGPWTFRHNPMFLLQCFQKLHYCDADTRLHLAGEFEDAGLERYIRSAAEAMDLDTVVFFDGHVKNLNRWLRDKHYIVSTAIDASAMPSVWAGMACGLRPVVHRFAGAEPLIASDYIFTLAEDFCKQVQSRQFEPAVYRRAAQQQFESGSAVRRIHAFLSRAEQANTQCAAPNPPGGTLPVNAMTQPAAAGRPHEEERSIHSKAEQALAAARELRRMMEPVSPGVPAAPSEMQPPRRTEPQSTLYQGLSVESLPETECLTVPFAGRQ
ncbi:MAG: tetratricopeptide repeat protein [Planctomycetaceae bacterium]|nr:tetratricopeptide repeat protein [Planctomycetaceae bacterium]